MSSINRLNTLNPYFQPTESPTGSSSRTCASPSAMDKPQGLSGSTGGLDLGGQGGELKELLTDFVQALVQALEQNPALLQGLSGGDASGGSSGGSFGGSSDSSGVGGPSATSTDSGSSGAPVVVQPGSASSAGQAAGDSGTSTGGASSGDDGTASAGSADSTGDTGSTGDAGSTGDTGDVSTDSTSSTSGSFSEADLYSDIKKTLSQGGGADASHSGPQYLQYWDPSTAEGKKNLDSFYKGIQSSHKEFFSNIPIGTYAKAVVANAAVESTLNPKLANGGLLQMSPNYFSDDFAKHGKAFGSLKPGGSFDQQDPGQQVEIWAWYTKNALVQGGTRPGQWGSSASAGVKNTYGNLWPTWVGGPGNANGNMQNYTPNIEAYFKKIGSESELKALESTALSSKYVDVK